MRGVRGGGFVLFFFVFFVGFLSWRGVKSITPSVGRAVGLSGCLAVMLRLCEAVALSVTPAAKLSVHVLLPGVLPRIYQ